MQNLFPTKEHTLYTLTREKQLCNTFHIVHSCNYYVLSCCLIALRLVFPNFANPYIALAFVDIYLFGVCNR